MNDERSSERPKFADYKQLINHLENFVNEKDPLIVSSLMTIFEDMKMCHSYLELLRSTAGPMGEDASDSTLVKAKEFFNN
jgi:hypothetical protein